MLRVWREIRKIKKRGKQKTIEKPEVKAKNKAKTQNNLKSNKNETQKN